MSNTDTTAPRHEYFIFITDEALKAHGPDWQAQVAYAQIESIGHAYKDGFFPLLREARTLDTTDAPAVQDFVNRAAEWLAIPSNRNQRSR